MKRLILSMLMSGATLLAFTNVGSATIVDAARVTIHCGTHTVTVSMVEFWYNDGVVFQDNAPGIGCTSGSGDTKLYEFGYPLDINGYECWYVADGGLPTAIHLPAGQFYFHYPLQLVSPSPGGVISPNSAPPAEGEAMMVISDHDALMWPSSECFQFRGGPYDYTCVTWYCETDFPPVFQITPGCGTPCSDPNCPPAQYLNIMWSAPCNPVPNIWCRVFWPVGLIQPGCWCYYFEYQLPVELSSFEATPVANGVDIRFATASESDMDHFEIWRSTSADAFFTRLVSIESNGNSTSEQRYEYVDRSVTAGTTYWYYLVDEDIQGHRLEHRDRIMAATPTGAAVPSSYSLAAYPNPFNPTTTIEFSLPASGRVNLSVYDMAGRFVTELANGSYSDGAHKVVFNAKSLSSGLYFAKLEAGSYFSTQKLLLIK